VARLAREGAIERFSPVIVPPLREQEAIAEALSDADALIESLEQLIAKQRHLKQGAMQKCSQQEVCGSYPHARASTK
jgi:type I restriction enzyme S subunit